MTMQRRFGRLLELRQWVSTMTYTLQVMFYCWLMYLKASERPACNTCLKIRSMSLFHLPRLVVGCHVKDDQH